MSFNTQLNTLHQRLLEAAREEHGEHNNSYSLMDLAEDLDYAEDVEELVEELLSLDLDDLYGHMDGDRYQRFLESLEGDHEPLNLPPPPPPRRTTTAPAPPPLYEDAIIDPPPYVELPPYF